MASGLCLVPAASVPPTRPSLRGSVAAGVTVLQVAANRMSPSGPPEKLKRLNDSGLNTLATVCAIRRRRLIWRSRHSPTEGRNLQGAALTAYRTAGASIKAIIAMRRSDGLRSRSPYRSLASRSLASSPGRSECQEETCGTSPLYLGRSASIYVGAEVSIGSYMQILRSQDSGCLWKEAQSGTSTGRHEVGRSSARPP